MNTCMYCLDSLVVSYTPDFCKSSPDLDIGPDFVYLDMTESSVCTSCPGRKIVLSFYHSSCGGTDLANSHVEPYTNIPKAFRILCTQFDMNTLRFGGEMACVEEYLKTTVIGLGARRKILSWSVAWCQPISSNPISSNPISSNINDICPISSKI